MDSASGALTGWQPAWAEGPPGMHGPSIRTTSLSARSIVLGGGQVWWARGAVGRPSDVPGATLSAGPCMEAVSHCLQRQQGAPLPSAGEAAMPGEDEDSQGHRGSEGLWGRWGHYCRAPTSAAASHPSCPSPVAASGSQTHSASCVQAGRTRVHTPRSHTPGFYIPLCT